MINFLLGTLAMASFVAGLYFLKFWKKTRDRFFLFFAAAFFIETLNRIVLSFVVSPENQPFSFPYLIRLGSFCLFLFALVDKNIKKRRF